MSTVAKNTARTLYRQIMSIVILLSVIFVPSVCRALEPPPVTPTNQFFIINSTGIPVIPDDYHVTVDGAVETPLSLALDDLMNYSPLTLMATLECYDPRIELIGNAAWTGVPLRDVIEDAIPLGHAVSLAFHSLDGYVLRGMSLDLMRQRDDFLLAYGINGGTLPIEQGYPVRLVVPGFYGYLWGQWISRIEVSTAPPQSFDMNSFPVHTKIFQPLNGDSITRAPFTIAGMAFVGNGREVTTVEISTDLGVTWEPAQLLNYFVPNVWKHWEFSWLPAQPGLYRIFVRAHDELGNIQDQNGFFGYADNAITVTAVCDVCQGNFDGDADVDSSDGAAFKRNFGRSDMGNPCTDELPCDGDFDCDRDVDTADAAKIRQDFGRSSMKQPCPDCASEPWCVYR